MATRFSIAIIILFFLGLNACSKKHDRFFPNANTAAISHAFLEENDLYLEDSGFVSNVSEDQFNAIINLAHKIYEPIAEQKKQHLYIYPSWESSEVNAVYSNFTGDHNINVFGGLARRPEITLEGLALVICHEIGHGFGGYPFTPPAVAPKVPGSVILPSAPVSTEGQADYYGASVCLRQLLPDIEKTTAPKDEFIEQACAVTKDPSLCTRQLGAGQSAGRLFAALRKISNEPSYTTPDKTIVTETQYIHPLPQCRLDTYFNGTMMLPRPACWFKE